MPQRIGMRRPTNPEPSVMQPGPGWLQDIKHYIGDLSPDPADTLNPIAGVLTDESLKPLIAALQRIKTTTGQSLWDYFKRGEQFMPSRLTKAGDLTSIEDPKRLAQVLRGNDLRLTSTTKPYNSLIPSIDQLESRVAAEELGLGIHYPGPLVQKKKLPEPPIDPKMAKFEDSGVDIDYLRKVESTPKPPVRDYMKSLEAGDQHIMARRKAGMLGPNINALKMARVQALADEWFKRQTGGK